MDTHPVLSSPSAGKNFMAYTLVSLGVLLLAAFAFILLLMLVELVARFSFWPDSMAIVFTLISFLAVVYLLALLIMRVVWRFPRVAREYRIYSDHVALYYANTLVRDIPFSDIEVVHHYRPPSLPKLLSADANYIQFFVRRGHFHISFNTRAILGSGLLLSSRRAGEIHIRIRNDSNDFRQMDFFLLWKSATSSNTLTLVPKLPEPFYRALMDTWGAWRSAHGLPTHSLQEVSDVHDEPLLVVAPHTGRGMLLRSIHPLNFGLFILIAAYILLVTVGRSDTSTAFATMLSLILIAPLCIISLGYWLYPYVLKRRWYPKMRFTFLKDRIIFPYGKRMEELRSIPREAITSVDVRRSLFQRLTQTGTLILNTLVVTGITPLGLAEVSVGLPDVRDPLAVASHIRAITGVSA